MKRFLMLSMGTLAVVWFGACSLFAPAADQAASAIDEYCERESYPARELYRREINSRTELGDVEITCDGDPE